MKNNIICTSLFVLISFQILGQNTYYISNQGNDSNDGISSQTPWKTISKINSVDFNPGDNILFRSGDIWSGNSLAIYNSGAEGNPIVISSYGSGEKPIISSRSSLENWKDPTKWTAVNNLDNIWKMSFECRNHIDRLWLDNKEALLASDYKLRDYIPQDNHLYKGDNGDGTIGVNSTHQFYFDPNSFTFYLYSPSNPATFYKSIIIPGTVKNGVSEKATIDIRGDYIKLQNIEVQGGIYATVLLNGADYITAENCNIGKFTNWRGFYGDLRLASDKTSDYVTISNCYFNSDWEWKYIFYTRRTPTAIGAANGASYWDIGYNTLLDWWMSIYIVGKDANSQFHDIHHNDISGPRNTFSKAIQISGGGIWAGSESTFVRFYNNYIHETVFGIQLSSRDNYIYYNIFENLTLTSVNEHAFGAGGMGSSIIRDTQKMEPFENYFFNNTYKNLRDYPHVYDGSYAKGKITAFYANNLYLNCGISKTTPFRISSNSLTNHYNNIFFNQSVKNSNEKIIYYHPLTESYSVNELNELSSKISNKVASGNKIHIGEESNLITTDLTLPKGSPAINSGIDISEFVPEGFSDMNGNIVDRKTPNVGALSTTETPNVERNPISKSNIKVFLEGAYLNNKMSSSLKVPNLQPYSESKWSHNGNELFASKHDNLIDWILVELRNSANKVTRKFSALLMADGKILNYEWNDDFSMYNIPDGEYYIAIYHRNHLPIISAQIVKIVDSQLDYDFTDSQEKAQGNNSMKDLGNNTFGMYSGDSDGNGVINNLDFGNVANNIFSSIYQSGDLDLNGIINVLDYSKINSNIFKKTVVTQ